MLIYLMVHENVMVITTQQMESLLRKTEAFTVKFNMPYDKRRPMKEFFMEGAFVFTKIPKVVLSRQNTMIAGGGGHPPAKMK